MVDSRGQPLTLADRRCPTVTMTALDMRGQAMTDEEVWLTRAEAARYLRVSVRTLDRMADAGEVTRYRLGRNVRFRLDELEQLPRSDRAQ